ncbi:MAG TPA: transcription termination factor NusA [Planctomycetota bacterium]|nr:transcription termination factor NusA [Planctomycetota bacterium]
MNGTELLRIVDAIHRDKSIDPELIFHSIEQALAQATKKALSLEEAPAVTIDRASGEISATDRGIPIDATLLGRIAYQQARQVFVQKLREAESDTVYNEYAHKKGDIVTAIVVRYDGPHLLCRIGERAEATMVKPDQVPGENYRIGGRVRAYVSEVEKRGTRIRIFISRAHEDFVRRLFELEVPEIADGTVVIKKIAREAGYRTKLTVASTNDRVDCLGACVGVRGSRIRNVVDELNGENVDIVRWSDVPKDLVRHALKPAEVVEVILNDAAHRATVYVTKDELSQAIGKGGRNVRLASKLSGWEIDIYEVGSDNQPSPAPPKAVEAGPSGPAEAAPEPPPSAEVKPETSENKNVESPS